jgi:hypothetical protein
MMRYRSAKTVPGVKASARTDSGAAIRPTTEDGVRGSGRAGVGARPVGICEIELIGEPQEGQKRPASEISAEQPGQRNNLRES